MALVCCLLGRLPAQVPPAFSFSATTWTSIGAAGSTIQFNADGSWAETWRNQHTTGHWQANPANNFVTVNRDDGVVFHFRLEAGQRLVRDRGRVIYQLTST